MQNKVVVATMTICTTESLWKGKPECTVKEAIKAILTLSGNKALFKSTIKAKNLIQCSTQPLR